MTTTTRQLDLFTGRARPEPKRYPEAPGHRGVATQVAAAKRIEPRAASIREQVRAHVASCGPAGATRQEIADSMGLKLQTVCGRVAELVAGEQVMEPGDTRDGRKIIVVRP